MPKEEVEKKEERNEHRASSTEIIKKQKQKKNIFKNKKQINLKDIHVYKQRLLKEILFIFYFNKRSNSFNCCVLNGLDEKQLFVKDEFGVVSVSGKNVAVGCNGEHDDDDEELQEDDR